MTKGDLVNAMTVDVEDYFQVSAFESHVDRGQWDSYPCRVERNVEIILELFDRHHARATFFMLGWVAERYPGLIRRIVENGHELASHGFSHVRIHDQNAALFRDDVRRAKALLEDTGGAAVRGYRAASFSIGRRTLWAFDVLAEEGYRYSSSIYPIRHDHYGMPEAPRFAFRPNPQEAFIEVPITTVSLCAHVIAVDISGNEVGDAVAVEVGHGDREGEIARREGDGGLEAAIAVAQ